MIHPTRGSPNRPSFAAVVANVDSDTARYIATTRVQPPRQEMIDDLKEMCKVSFSKLTKCILHLTDTISVPVKNVHGLSAT